MLVFYPDGILVFVQGGLKRFYRILGKVTQILLVSLLESNSNNSSRFNQK